MFQFNLTLVPSNSVTYGFVLIILLYVILFSLAVTDPEPENMQAPQEKKKVSMQSYMLKANLVKSYSREAFFVKCLRSDYAIEGHRLWVGWGGGGLWTHWTILS